MPAKKSAAPTTTTKSVSKTVASKSKKVVEPKVVEPKAVEPKAVEAPAEVDAEAVQSELSTQFAEFSGRLTSLRTQISALLTEFRALQKRAERELKASQKASQKRKRKTAVAVSIVANLALLGFFKYFVFVQENLNVLLELFGANPTRVLTIVLPTYQCICSRQTL